MGYKSNEEVADMSPTPSAWMRALPQILAVSVKNILLLAFGMTLGFPTILIPGLTAPEESFYFNAEGLSWIGSVNLICVPVGSLVSGAVSQAIGRKRAMQVVNIPFVFAWILFRFSVSEWQVFLALAMTGLSGGFLEAPVLTYVAEVTQPKLRGVLSTTSSMAVIAGVLIMFLLGTFFQWRTVALISCVFNVLSFTLLFFVPESPHWLISHNRLLDARKSLAWLRGWTTLDDIEPEYKQIYREVKESSAPHGTDNPAFDGNMNDGKAQNETSETAENKRTKLEALKLFTKKNFLWPFSLVATVFLFVHVTGMTTLQTYAIPIFDSLQAPIDKYYATVIMGIVELMGAIAATALVHYTGKRLLNFISVTGVAICFSVVGTYAYSIGVTDIIIPNKNTNTTMEVTFEGNGYNWVPLTFLSAAAFMSHMGIRILPWILTGEVFNNETRSAAAGFCSAFTYIISFAVNKAFFAIVRLLSLPGTFWGHAAMAVLFFIFLYFCLPETEGKTLGQINEHFSGGTKMGDHVYRGRKHALKKEEERQKKMGLNNVAFKSEEHVNGANFESKL